MNDLFSSIYDFLYYSPMFSNELYVLGLYSILGIVLVLSTFVLGILYYYGIDHPRFNRWFHWLLIACTNSFWAFLFGMLYPQTPMEEAGMQFGTEYFSLGIANAVLAFVLFVIVSFCCRWWSTNCRHTPIPQ